MCSGGFPTPMTGAHLKAPQGVRVRGGGGNGGEDGRHHTQTSSSKPREVTNIVIVLECRGLFIFKPDRLEEIYLTFINYYGKIFFINLFQINIFKTSCFMETAFSDFFYEHAVTAVTVSVCNQDRCNMSLCKMAAYLFLLPMKDVFFRSQVCAFGKGS